MFDKLPIALRTNYLKPDVTRKMVKARADHIRLVDRLLRTGKCRGGEMTGWLKPDRMLRAGELSRLKRTAQRLQRETDVLLVIGIGGSYLGARAVIEALAEDPERVVYAGTNISTDHIEWILSRLKGKRVAINVVSKSGTTTEPAIAFRLLKRLAKKPARRHIFATTENTKEPETGEWTSTLRRLAEHNGYGTFVFPSNVGGRYSVLSAAGLLPIAYAGINIDDLVRGGKDCAELCKNPDPTMNPAYYYACARNILHHQGFVVELLASFEPRLHYFAEWWKQLFGESEGKEDMGSRPAAESTE